MLRFNWIQQAPGWIQNLVKGSLDKCLPNGGQSWGVRGHTPAKKVEIKVLKKVIWNIDLYMSLSSLAYQQQLSWKFKQ